MDNFNEELKKSIKKPNKIQKRKLVSTMNNHIYGRRPAKPKKIVWDGYEQSEN